MRPVYSQNFFSVQGQSGVSLPVQTPFDQVWILRDIDVYYNSIDPELGIYFSDHNSNATFFQVQIDLAEVGAPSHHQWTGRQVFGPGTSWTVDVIGSLASPKADVRVSGYALSYP